jgi:hypothetical protein
LDVWYKVRFVDAFGRINTRAKPDGAPAPGWTC